VIYYKTLKEAQSAKDKREEEVSEIYSIEIEEKKFQRLANPYYVLAATYQNQIAWYL